MAATETPSNSWATVGNTLVLPALASSGPAVPVPLLAPLQDTYQLKSRLTTLTKILHLRSKPKATHQGYSPMVTNGQGYPQGYSPVTSGQGYFTMVRCGQQWL